MLRRIDSLDRVFIVAIVCLLAAIGVTIARGDQIGIAVQSFSPVDVASSRPRIRMTFDEAIDPQKASAYVAINPPVPGHITVSGQEVDFLPSLPLQPGKVYSVTAHQGIAATDGRALKKDVQWQFTVRAPRAVFIGSPDGGPPNLYLLDPALPNKPQKITNSQIGVGNYDVAPDGSQIVYGEIPVNGLASLYLWDAASGTTSLLYNCPDAWCGNPAWRPDGSAIAFDYLANTSAIAKVSRVWVLDMTTKTAKPLFSDNQQLASTPRWSPDNQHLAVYDSQDSQIIIHDFGSGDGSAGSKDIVIPSPNDDSAHYSPDGTRLYLHILVAPEPGKSVLHLILIDPTSTPIKAYHLTPDSEEASDEDAVWLPTSDSLIDVRALSGSKGIPPKSQVVRIEAAHGDTTPLLAQDGFQPANLALSPVGDNLLLNWFPVGKSSDSAGIWLYNLPSKQLKQIIPAGSDANWLS